MTQSRDEFIGAKLPNPVDSSAATNADLRFRDTVATDPQSERWALLHTVTADDDEGEIPTSFEQSPSEQLNQVTPRVKGRINEAARSMQETSSPRSAATVSAEAVANFFLTLAKNAGQELDQMKIQKLVYFSHGWHLGLTGTPLLDEQVQAWSYGPVIYSLYKAFAKYGSEPITDFVVDYRNANPDDPFTFEAVVPKIESEHSNPAQVKALLDRIWDVYGKYTGVQLSNLTHQAGGPWDKVRQEYSGGEMPKYTTIPQQYIRDYFVGLLDDS